MPNIERLRVFDPDDLWDLVNDKTRVASKQSVGEPRIVILAGHELAALLEAAGYEHQDKKQ